MTSYNLVLTQVLRYEQEQFYRVHNDFIDQQVGSLSLSVSICLHVYVSLLFIGFHAVRTKSADLLPLSQ